MQVFLSILFVGFYLGLTVHSVGQTIDAQDAGTQLEQRFIQAEKPLSQRPTKQLRLETTNAPPDAGAIDVIIKNIEVVGNTVYSAAQLNELTVQLLGKHQLDAIYNLANQLTSKYSNDGYLLSRVIVPPQELDPSAATIRLQAIEGWIDEVVWPVGLEKYPDYFSKYSDKITAARPIHKKTLERYLLLANDLPSFVYESTLEPSTKNTGASRLVLELSQKSTEYGASVDNHGTDGRGPYQFTANIALNNALKRHERISGSVATSFETQELQYGQLEYRQVLSAEGLTFALVASADKGEPGTDTLRSLSFKSHSRSLAATLSYPIIRSRTQNLFISGGFFAKDYYSDTFNGRFNQDNLRGIRLGANFDHFDQWNGITQLTSTFSHGINGFGSSSNNNSLATRSNGRVDFTKLELGFVRNQSLANNFSFLGSIQGQYAGASLLSSEECTYGGNAFGRAFNSSTLSGDHCFKALGELRYDLPNLPSNITQAQLVGFTDFGKTWQRNPANGSSASDEASSVGFGVRLGWQNRLSANFSAAKRLHGTTGDNSWRARFQISVRH